MAKMKTDVFSQIGYIQVTESAANTLTFNSLSVFSNILTPKGLLIERIEYYPSSAMYVEMTTAADSITFGVAGDDSMATVALDDPQVYDHNTVVRLDFGTAGSASLRDSPIIKDFSGLSGGGRLVPADRVYVYLKGNGLASAGTMTIRFHFTVVDLDAQEYLELAQALRVLT